VGWRADDRQVVLSLGRVGQCLE